MCPETIQLFLHFSLGTPVHISPMDKDFAFSHLLPLTPVTWVCLDVRLAVCTVVQGADLVQELPCIYWPHFLCLSVLFLSTVAVTWLPLWKQV